MENFQFSGKIRHNVCAGNRERGGSLDFFCTREEIALSLLSQSVPARYHTGFEFAVLRLGLPGKRGTI